MLLNNPIHCFPQVGGTRCFPRTALAAGLCVGTPSGGYSRSFFWNGFQLAKKPKPKPFWKRDRHPRGDLWRSTSITGAVAEAGALQWQGGCWCGHEFCARPVWKPNDQGIKGSRDAKKTTRGIQPARTGQNTWIYVIYNIHYIWYTLYIIYDII